MIMGHMLRVLKTIKRKDNNRSQTLSCKFCIQLGVQVSTVTLKG